MTIDIRAKVTCNLGDVISASISDDYIQGSGLIKTTGSCQINGIVTPRTGDLVSFQYVKSGITRRIPRALRVLSSFADPFRRITTIQLGCKFTYLANLKDPLSWDAFDDPLNSDRDEDEINIVTVPIWASSIANRCLSALGISGTAPLTNKFSVAEFDFSSGYVDVLSNLLVSESYCGYLDQNENFRLISLALTSNGGPIIASKDLIDVGPINFGDIPGDAVFVRYNTLRLRVPDGEEIEPPPEEEEEEDGEQQPGPGDNFEESTNKSNILISWTNQEGVAQFGVFPIFDQTRQLTRFRVFTKRNPDGSVERRNLVDRKWIYHSKSLYAVAGNVVSEFLSAGLGIGNSTLRATTEETYSYDSDGNETLRNSTKIGNSLFEEGALPIQFVYDNGAVSVGSRRIPLERTTVISRTGSGFTSSQTQNFVVWPKTVYGQQAIAVGSQGIDSVTDAQRIVDSVSEGLYLLDTTSVVSRSGSGNAQEGPLPADKVNEGNVDTEDPDVDPDNGYRTESVSQTQVVTGSQSSQNRIELQMPYAPDDTFSRFTVSTDPLKYRYTAFRSDAPQKARKFGDVQNRMLLGNRNGMNIQIEPEKLPPEPFAPLFVQAAGVIALYRVNAASWTIDASGIIASTDAMFWGTAGTT